MPFVPKDWKDRPNRSTPLSAAAIEDLETRLAEEAHAGSPEGLEERLDSVESGEAWAGGTDGYVLVFDGAGNPAWLPAAEAITNISEAADLDAPTALVDGNVLYYDSASETFKGIEPVLNVLTIKGDSIGFDGSTVVREAVGSNGQAQLADSAAATGKSWQTVALKTYVDALLAANDAMVFKGAINASSNPNYPAADAGHVYKISVAGKIGGASGTNVEIGDTILCTVDSSSAGTQAAVGANWTVVQANLDGAVIGPASATSGDIATFSGAGGKLIQDSGLALDVDGTLAANSDAKLASQKATKTYVDAHAGGSAVAVGRALIAGVKQFSIPGVPGGSAVAGWTSSANRAQYFPFVVDSSITIDQLIAELTTGVAASTFRMAIYNADTDWQPTTLIANTDTGTIAAAAADQGVKAVTITDTVLAAGRYLFWLAASSGNHIFRAVQGSPGIFLGYPVALGGGAHFTQIYRTAAQTYAAPPSTGVAWDAASTSSQPTFSWPCFVRVKTP